MTQRTNQFNTTAIRRSEADLQALLAAGHEIYTAEVSDRFGDYGLVGVMIVRPEDGGLYLDSMLLSCRALGRGVEHKMLAWLGERAAMDANVVIPFRGTERNHPARQFLEGLPSGEQEHTE